jgi:hypothetical protein
MSFIDSQ